MKVLLFPSSYPPVLGGLQTVAQALAQHLLRRGHEVRLVTNRYPRSLPAFEVLDDVPVQRWLFLTPELGHLQRGRSDLFVASFYFFPVTLFHLAHLMRTFHPDVVNVHFPDAQIPFILWLRQRFRFRLVVSLHGHEVLRWFGVGRTTKDERRTTNDNHRCRSVVGCLRSILQEADAVTACSRYLLDRAIELEPSVVWKGHVIHNGIDPERFRDKTPYEYPWPYILACGRLTYQKGFDMLLEAFAQVTPKHPEVGLLLAGEGEEWEALQTQAHRLELNDRVHFCGRAMPEEIVWLLNGCLFVVVPSRSDTFGIVALEAMAAGKAVLATRVGGLVELLNGSVNQLVEPTVEGLAGGLGEWLRRREEVEALGEQNHQRAAEHTWSRVVERYLEVFCGD